MNGESRVTTETLPCVKQVTVRSCSSHREPGLELRGGLEVGGGGEGG